MIRTLKRSVVIMLMFIIAMMMSGAVLTTFAATEWDDSDFTFSEITNGDEVVAYSVTGLSDSGKDKLKTDSELVLPDTHEGKNVTEIGAGTSGTEALDKTGNIDKIGTFGFMEDSVIYVPTKVQFPANLEKIGINAFSAATSIKEVKTQLGLTELAIPRTVKRIENLAFSMIPVEEIFLPNTVEYYGTGVFNASVMCAVKIKKVTFEENQTITAIPQSMFANQAISELVIPEGITTIGRAAFSYNEVTKLTLPEGLETIVRDAFVNHQLQELTIPKSVKSIEQSAFGVKVTGSSTRPATLTKVNIPEDSALQSIAKQAFDGSLLKEFNLPASVTTLNKDAFINNQSGFDDGKVLLRVATAEQLQNSADGKTYVANGSGHKASVVVTFDSNGGKAVDPASVNTKLGFKLEAADFPTPEALDENKSHVFEGWFTAAEDGDKVDENTEFNKDTTVYAHWKDLKKEAVTAAETAKTAAEDAKKAADEADKAKKTADESRKAADAAAATPGQAAVDAAKKAEEDAKAAAKAAAAAKTAADKAKSAADAAKGAADALVEQLDKAGASDAEKAEAAGMQAEAATMVTDAETAVTKADKAKTEADKAVTDAEAATKNATSDKSKADAAAKSKAEANAKVKKIKTVTVNVKTVNAKAIAAAIKKAGGNKQYVTKVVLGKKVTKISKGAFKNYKKVKTLVVKSKKLKKSKVKGSLKNSGVTKVQVKVGTKKAVNKKYVKKYKKYFTKKNAGKAVKVTL